MSNLRRIRKEQRKTMKNRLAAASSFLPTLSATVAAIVAGAMTVRVVRKPADARFQHGRLASPSGRGARRAEMAAKAAPARIPDRRGRLYKKPPKGAKGAAPARIPGRRGRLYRKPPKGGMKKHLPRRKVPGCRRELICRRARSGSAGRRCRPRGGPCRAGN